MLRKTDETYAGVIIVFFFVIIRLFSGDLARLCVDVVRVSQLGDFLPKCAALLKHIWPWMSVIRTSYRRGGW